MKKDSYGVTLKTVRQYREMFKKIKKRRINILGEDVLIEHVGGTSLISPTGKGDIDVYVAYHTHKERVALERRLQGELGTYAKKTPIRTRFNYFFQGVEVEIQLSNLESLRQAVALRQYLNTHSAEAKKYASTIVKIRKSALGKMYKVKSAFSKKALKEMEGSVG